MTSSDDYFYQRTGRTLDEINERKKHFYYCNFFASIFCLATFLGLFTFIAIAVYLYFLGDSTSRILHSLIFIIPCTLTSIWKVYAKLNLRRVTDEEKFFKIIQTQNHAYHSERYGRDPGVTDCNTNFTNGAVHFDHVVYHRRENDQVVSNDGLLNNLEQTIDVALKNVSELNAQDIVPESNSENNSAKGNTESTYIIYEEIKQRVPLTNSDAASEGSSKRFTVVKLDDSLGVQEENTDIFEAVYNDSEGKSSIKIVTDVCSNDISTERLHQDSKQDVPRDNVDLASSSSKIFEGVTPDDNLGVKEVDGKNCQVVNNNKNRELDKEHCSAINNMDPTKTTFQEPDQYTPVDISDFASLHSPQRFTKANVCDNVDREKTNADNACIVLNNNKGESNQETTSEKCSKINNIDSSNNFILKPEQYVPATTADESTSRSSKRFKKVRFADNPIIHEIETELSEVVIDKVELIYKNESENSYGTNNMYTTKNWKRESKRDAPPRNGDVSGICSPQRSKKFRFADQDSETEIIDVVNDSDEKESDYETGSENSFGVYNMDIADNLDQQPNQDVPLSKRLADLFLPKWFRRTEVRNAQEAITEKFRVINDNNKGESNHHRMFHDSVDVKKVITEMFREIHNKNKGKSSHEQIFHDGFDVQEAISEIFRVIHNNSNGESSHERIFPDGVVVQEAIAEMFQVIHKNIKGETHDKRMFDDSFDVQKAIAEHFRVNHHNKGESYHERIVENSSRFSNKQSAENVYKQVEQDVLANNAAVNDSYKGCRRKVKSTTNVQESEVRSKRSRKNKENIKYVNQESELDLFADDSDVPNLGSIKHFRRVRLDGSVEAGKQFSEVFVNNIEEELDFELRSKKSSRRKHRDKTKDRDQRPNENLPRSCTSKYSSRVRKYRVHDVAVGGCKYYNEQISRHERGINNKDSDNHDVESDYPTVRYRNGKKEYVFGPLPPTEANDNEELSDEIWVTTRNPAMAFDEPDVCYGKGASKCFSEPTPSSASGIKSSLIDIDNRIETAQDRPRSSSRCGRKNCSENASHERICMDCSDVHYDYDNFFSPYLN